MARTPDDFRNVCLIGRGGSGKTTLLEAILAKTGAIPRAGSVDDGSSVLDADDLEKERKHSIDPALGFFEKDGVTVNLMDTPGYRDFMGNVYGPLAGVEAAVLVVDASDGVRPHTRKLWKLVEAAGLPGFVVIQRLDREQADFDGTLAQLQKLNSKCVPLSVPVGVGASLSGVELTLGPAKGSSDLAQEHGNSFMETIVESNEELLEKYLGGEEIPGDALDKQLVAAVRDREVFPVLCTSVPKDLGLDHLVDALVKYAPSPVSGIGRAAALHDAPDEKVALEPKADGPLCGFVIRNVSDPYVGRLTWVRMLSGSMVPNEPFVNPHTGKSEKVGKIVKLLGTEQVPVESAVAGDLVVLLKMESLKTFDTVASAGQRFELAAPKLPMPMYGRALEPKTATDEKKFSEALTKVTDEDPSVSAELDSRTHEMVVSGASQLHLQMIISRLKGRYHVEVNTKEPKIPYLETITAKGDDHYRHKKQSGGSGEFAEVYLRVEPRERGEGNEFANEVFGGAISESYVSSAQKGIKSMMELGAIAGYPVVDVRVTVYDGKEHPVDSKDVAFQKAGKEAFKLAMNKAKPVILEPIVHLEVTFPQDVVGDVTGDLNRRRARVQGMDTEGDFQTIKAQAPLAELNEYSNALGAMSGGQGTYEIEMSHYEVAPTNVAQKIVEAFKAQDKKED